MSILSSISDCLPVEIFSSLFGVGYLGSWKRGWAVVIAYLFFVAAATNQIGTFDFLLSGIDNTVYVEKLLDISSFLLSFAILGYLASLTIVKIYFFREESSIDNVVLDVFFAFIAFIAISMLNVNLVFFSSWKINIFFFSKIIPMNIFVAKFFAFTLSSSILVAIYIATDYCNLWPNNVINSSYSKSSFMIHFSSLITSLYCVVFTYILGIIFLKLEPTLAKSFLSELLTQTYSNMIYVCKVIQNINIDTKAINKFLEDTGIIGLKNTVSAMINNSND